MSTVIWSYLVFILVGTILFTGLLFISDCWPFTAGWFLVGTLTLHKECLCCFFLEDCMRQIVLAFDDKLLSNMYLSTSQMVSIILLTWKICRCLHEMLAWDSFQMLGMLLAYPCEFYFQPRSIEFPCFKLTPSAQTILHCLVTKGTIE